MNWISKKTLGFITGLALTVGAVGVLTGCGDQAMAPTGVVDQQVIVQDAGKGNGGTAQASIIGDLLNDVIGVVEETEIKVVGVLGGVLEMPLLSGQARFAIPANAVGSPKKIEMDVTQVKVGDRFFTEFEFGPDGLVFKKSTKLTLSLPYEDGTVVSLRWFNPKTDQWDLQDSKPVRGGQVQFFINHFSKYGIS